MKHTRDQRFARVVQTTKSEVGRSDESSGLLGYDTRQSAKFPRRSDPDQVD
jgi:hypothetical protein